MRLLPLLLLTALPLAGQITFVTEDIDRFWTAYDSIRSTPDTAQQSAYLERLYLAPGTTGLRELREVRSYRAEEYLAAIRDYPAFWESIRRSTRNTATLRQQVDRQVDSLGALYPDLRPATAYLSMGVFRTGGTLLGNHILIGSEMMLPDSTAATDGLPQARQHYFATYPVRDYFPFLCIHEYVHALQKEMVHNLLSYCIYEGIAEFMAVLATGEESYAPAVAYAAEHPTQVRDRFEQEMYMPSKTYDWLWGDTAVYGHRDMGYAVGYQLAQGYYGQAADKAAAIRIMIELDLTDETAVTDYVDRSGYFTQPLDTLFERYQRSRPYIVRTSGVEPDSRDVAPGTQTMTFHFSEPLNGYNTGVDFGPDGPEAFPTMSTERVWSADNTEWTITMQLEPNRHYQFLVSGNFRLESGVHLRPRLIEFWTGE